MKNEDRENTSKEENFFSHQDHKIPPEKAALEKKPEGDSKRSTAGWNELEFLSWHEFKQMAPSIIQLEITRLGTLIDQFPLQSDFRNSLVKARFNLKEFTKCLQETPQPPLTSTCVASLQSAIVAISVELDEVDATAAKTIAYILDRLNYVYNRVDLIY